MKCEGCGVIGELDEPMDDFVCPECGEVMHPADAPPKQEGGKTPTVSISREQVNAYKQVKVAKPAGHGFGKLGIKTDTTATKGASKQDQKTVKKTLVASGKKKIIVPAKKGAAAPKPHAQMNAQEHEAKPSKKDTDSPLMTDTRTLLNALGTVTQQTTPLNIIPDINFDATQTKVDFSSELGRILTVEERELQQIQQMKREAEERVRRLEAQKELEKQKLELGETERKRKLEEERLRTEKMKQEAEERLAREREELEHQRLKLEQLELRKKEEEALEKLRREKEEIQRKQKELEAEKLAREKRELEELERKRKEDAELEKQRREIEEMRKRLEAEAEEKNIREQEELERKRKEEAEREKQKRELEETKKRLETEAKEKNIAVNAPVIVDITTTPASPAASESQNPEKTPETGKETNTAEQPVPASSVQKTEEKPEINKETEVPQKKAGNKKTQGKNIPARMPGTPQRSKPASSIQKMEQPPPQAQDPEEMKKKKLKQIKLITHIAIVAVVLLIILLFAILSPGSKNSSKKGTSSTTQTSVDPTLRQMDEDYRNLINSPDYTQNVAQLADAAEIIRNLDKKISLLQDYLNKYSQKADTDTYGRAEKELKRFEELKGMYTTN